MRWGHELGGGGRAWRKQKLPEGGHELEAGALWMKEALPSVAQARR